MIDIFLSNIHLPKLTEDEQGEISCPLTQKEIEKAISSLNCNKSPGEDGFPPEFYKEFKYLLIPLLMHVINLATKTQTLPDSFSTALITVMHKKNKNPKKCSSYKPISLLNTDFKIISKSLTNRLNRFLPKLINMDQTGFMNKCLATDNLGRLLTIFI